MIAWVRKSSKQATEEIAELRGDVSFAYHWMLIHSEDHGPLDTACDSEVT